MVDGKKFAKGLYKMKHWIQKIAVYALAAATACFCVACASAQPSGSASENTQQTTSQELTYDKQNHTPIHQSGCTFQVIDVTSGEESATIFFTMSPLDSKQAAENHQHRRLHRQRAEI